MNDSLGGVFRRECGADAVLRAIGGKMARELKAGARPSPAQLVEEVQRRAASHYQSLWESCSPEEKLLLVQLAEEGVANPQWEQTLADLQRKRLVVQDPVHRLFNESFRRFVLTVPGRRQVLRGEQEGASTWSALRGVLWPGLLLLTVFLAFTQRHHLEGLETAVPFIGAGLTGLSKLYDFFKTARVETTGGPTAA